MSNVVDMDTTEIAILMADHINKYHPGTQPFRLQSISGLNKNNRILSTTSVSLPNLMNKDKVPIITHSVNTSAVIKIRIPREVARRYPKKFIPIYTKFIVSFNSGDITKPVIVGGYF